MADYKPQLYNDPGNSLGQGVVPSSYSAEQLRTFHYSLKAIVTAEKLRFFSQLADAVNMPKHFGKTFKIEEVYPILSDKNKNDQGLDAQGHEYNDGNLYGLGTDIGDVAKKYPLVGEKGGEVNRVGVTRITRQGSMKRYGIHQKWTSDVMEFDSNPNLYMYMTNELIKAAHEIYEKVLEIDLINNAGVVRYAGAATSRKTINKDHIVTFKDLVQLRLDLDKNRTPTQTTIIKGSRFTDTMTINSCRVMYVSPEVVNLFMKMKDYHDRPAFVSIEKYAAAGDILKGEVGKIDQFRIIQVNDLSRWTGAGAAKTVGTSNNEVHMTNDKVDVFPLLVVGDDAFNTIGFQLGGNDPSYMKMKQYTQKEANATEQDPYGLRRFGSLQWFYGFIAKRPERIALINTAVETT